LQEAMARGTNGSPQNTGRNQRFCKTARFWPSSQKSSTARKPGRLSGNGSYAGFPHSSEGGNRGNTGLYRFPPSRESEGILG